MTKHIVRFTVPLDLAVTVDAVDDEEAEEIALVRTKEYLDTVFGSRGLGIVADSTTDGLEAYAIEATS